MEYLEHEDIAEIAFRPLWWQKQGLMQTASGYGRKLTSSKMVRLAKHDSKRWRRVYVTCYGNADTAWVTVGGKRYIVPDTL